jgi:hypothetical protein
LVVATQFVLTSAIQDQKFNRLPAPPLSIAAGFSGEAQMTPNGNLLPYHIEPAAVITITVTDHYGIERIDTVVPKIR